MQIDKEQIITKLTEFGQQDKATQSEQQLPDRVDTDQHASLLDKLGINVSDLLGGHRRQHRRHTRPLTGGAGLRGSAPAGWNGRPLRPTMTFDHAHARSHP
jgi:hypothetical protein